jgi:ribosome biogenesis protein MAK21
MYPLEHDYCVMLKYSQGPFLAHFHPSVSLFASRLIRHEAMPAKPDLSLHTLIHFLDRFVYRNAKSSPAPRGSSIMQPLGGDEGNAMILSVRSNSKNLNPVNSEAFWKKKSDEVDVDEAFFHKYFSQTAKITAAAGNQRGGKASKQAEDDESDNDEEEDEIWKALVDSRPDIEGSDEGDSDLEMHGMESDSAMESEVDFEGESDVEDGEGGSASDDFDLEGEEGALNSSDDEVPSDIDLSAVFDKELETNRRGEVDSSTDTKQKRRRKLKSLPTFASADDYAAMLVDDDL